MKSLKTLIRLHRNRVDEQRRQLGQLQNKQAQLEQMTATLVQELKQEQVMAAKTPEMSTFFGDFAERIRKRRDTIAQEMMKLEKQMAELSEKIRESFAELKKFEIVEERRKKEAAAEQDRKDVIQMDEVAITGHRRKNKPENAE